MSSAKVKSSMDRGWIHRNFRATPRAAKWNDAAIVVGCLSGIPLAAYGWTGNLAYWQALKVLSVV